MDKKLRRDLKVLARFIQVYCRDRHEDVEKTGAEFKTHDVEAIAGTPVLLCGDCTKLLAHALVKRSRCPLDPKPACKHCPNHCYHPRYRAMIREVMKSSGRKLAMSGRIDYLYRLLF